MTKRPRRKADKHYNKTQLRMGTKVELEHTKSRILAKKIAKDHLNEISNYYTRLRRMESKHKPKKRNYKKKK